MNIALMCHNRKQELMVQFCTAYCGVLSKHTVCATNATGRMVAEATGLPVALWDERRTTVDAHRILGEQGVRAKNRKDKIDSVAATLILEGYLDWKRLQAQRQEREEETP